MPPVLSTFHRLILSVPRCELRSGPHRKCDSYLDTGALRRYISVSQTGAWRSRFIAPACQAGGRGFNPRRSRIRPLHRGRFCTRSAGHETACRLSRNVLRAVAQGLARSVRDREVGSSNLPSPRSALTERTCLSGRARSSPLPSPRSALTERTCLSGRACDHFVQFGAAGGELRTRAGSAARVAQPEICPHREDLLVRQGSSVSHASGFVFLGGRGVPRTQGGVVSALGGSA